MPRYSSKSPVQRAVLRRKLWSILLFVIIASVVTVGAYLWHRGTSVNISLRKDDLCPVESSPSGHYAIFIDTTDRYNVIQATFLKDELRLWRDAVPAHAKLAVFALDDIPEEMLSPEFEGCNPGQAADPWIQNPRQIETRWREGFDQPVREVIDSLIERPPMPESPIMEMIQAVSIATFHQEESVRPRRLLIVSDMLQNTPEYSQYGEPELDFAEFRATEYYQKVYTDLTDVEVEILYARRDGAEAAAVQGMVHARFWADYLRSMGARVSSIKRIEG